MTPVSEGRPTQRKRRVDSFSLVIGLLLTVFAAGTLWTVFASIPWSVVKFAAPLVLVAVGVTGLATSRRSGP